MEWKSIPLATPSSIDALSELAAFTQWSRERVEQWCLSEGVAIIRLELPSPLSGKATLFCRGDLTCLTFTRAVAIVGARKASLYGLRVAAHFARGLTARGSIIISGLARGVDSSAHWGCVKASGRTIAVMGCGLDRVYPSENGRLAAEIVLRGGLLISQFPPGTPPLPHHFPLRNRLMAALCGFCLVVQAGEKSGSLITATDATNFGREVGVVPGPFDDESFRGSHFLIQQGAKLVCRVEDVLEEFPTRIDNKLSVHPLGVELEKEFRSSEGSLTLDQLLSLFAGEDRVRKGELFSVLESLLSCGLLVEPQPNVYLWVGE